MQAPVVLIGVGEMGGVFARGLLKAGHPVFPLNRGDDPRTLAATLPDPAMALLSVAEGDLAAALDGLPASWRDSLCLLQNELLPADFAQFPKATVISVWFEKKPGQDAKVIQPSPAFGPRAELLEQALGAIGIPVKVLADSDQLAFELVVKNLYILTSNIAGLKVGGTVGELWRDHQAVGQAVVDDVIALQEAMTGRTFDHPALIQAMLAAFNGDPGHKCMGRSAPARLARALEHAARLGLDLPTLQRIQAEHSAA